MSVESSSRAILALACKRKEEISVTLKDSNREYRSSFVGMPEKGGVFFYIDTLPQDAARKYLTANKSILVGKFDMHDVRYNFESTFADIVKYNGLEALKLKMPSKIGVLQRRQYFRVEPRISDPVKILLPGGEEATAIDVSTGGASFWCKRYYTEESIIDIQVTLPGESNVLHLKFKVIASDKIKESFLTRRKSVGPYKVRGRFQNQSNKEIQTIQHYGHARQREVIRVSG